MHFTCQIPKPEGIYHVRLYDATTHSMEVHSGALFNASGESIGTEVSGDLVFDEGFGDAQSAFENELFQGAIEHQNWKLSLDADPIMAELVAAWRNLAKDVWLEVVLEQRAIGIPTAKPFVMAQPLKKRLVWWGKLVRNEAAGYVDYQSYKELNSLVRKPERKVHIGGLEMTFVHWLHVIFSRGSTDLLNRIRTGARNPFPNHISIFQIFNDMLRVISPTKLYALSDSTLVEWHKWKVISGIPSGMHTPYSLVGGIHSIKELTRVFVQVIDNFPAPHFTALFASPTDPGMNGNAGENSLFNRWKTLGDAMVTLCREFFLKCDVELPTLEDVRKVAGGAIGFTNHPKDLENYWLSTSRWVFSSIDDFPLELTVAPLEKSIKYSPAAVWIKSVNIDVPSYSGASGLIPTPASWKSSYGEGKDISYKTLFRFIGQSFLTGNPGDDARGVELMMTQGINTVLMYARQARFTRDNEEFTYNYWNQFHVFKNIDLWGGARALIEFEHEGVGITPFGDGVNDFGFLDWGDFANLRYFDASPGLLYSGSEYGRFSVIEVARPPGKNSKIRGIERRLMKPSEVGEIDIPPVPPPPDPPDVDPPPYMIEETLTGVQVLTFAITNHRGMITRIEFYIDDILMHTTGNFLGVAPETPLSPQFVLDTGLLANSSHTIKLKFSFDDAPVTQESWTFSVLNP